MRLFIVAYFGWLFVCLFVAGLCCGLVVVIYLIVLFVLLFLICGWFVWLNWVCFDCLFEFSFGCLFTFVLLVLSNCLVTVFCNCLLFEWIILFGVFSACLGDVGCVIIVNCWWLLGLFSCLVCWILWVVLCCYAGDVLDVLFVGGWICFCFVVCIRFVRCACLFCCLDGCGLWYFFVWLFVIDYYLTWLVVFCFNVLFVVFCLRVVVGLVDWFCFSFIVGLIICGCWYCCFALDLVTCDAL